MNNKLIATAILYLCMQPFSLQAATPKQSQQKTELVILTKTVQKELQNGKLQPEAPLLQIAGGSPLHRQIRTELNSKFGLLIQQLDLLSQPYSSIETGCEQLQNKTLLFLSDEDGGYARKGFWLQQKGGALEYCDLLYVDMTVSQPDITNGKFLEVFAHEMAHVYLRRLKGELPPAPSGRFHNVFAVTDYQTAFDEGFGIYFQTMASVFSEHKGFKARIEGRTTVTGAESWFSNLDGRERIFGVMHNQFVFEKQVPPNLASMAAYQYEGIANSYGPQLKNAQAMLSSEGIVATLFYRLATTPELFALQPDNEDWLAAAVASHQELFALMAKNRWDTQQVPYIQLLQHMLDTNKAYASAAVKNFVMTTYASSTNADLTRIFQQSIDAGLSGDLSTFMQSYQQLPAAVSQQVELIIKSPGTLTAELGKPLWLLQPKVQISEAPWSKTQQSLSVNLNTATAAELTLLQIFSESQIELFLAERIKDGPYRDLQDLSRRLVLSASQYEQLTDLARLFNQHQGYIRH